jgi:hypothetical protein
VKDNLIVIDDINCCYEKISDYPSIDKIIDIILSINKDYFITIKYNALFAEMPSLAFTLSE